MLRFLIHRLAISFLVLLGLSLLAFFMVRLVPGDPVDAMLGLRADSPEARAALEEKFGLNEPVVVQYGLWLGNVLQGDFGQATTGRPVTTEIMQALPVTLELASLGLLFALLTGIPLGLIAAVRRDGPTDYAATTLSLLGLSIPGFWLGTMLILLVSYQLDLLPSFGYVPLTRDPLGNLRHMILPALALGTAVAAVVARMTRTSMLDVLGQDYIRTARAKGLSPWRVMGKHGLRNALVPLLTIIGIQTGYLLGGSIVIEEVFSLSGLGRLVLRALGNRDYMLLQAAILLIGTVFLFINLIVDLLYAAVDPRIRVE